jgi:AraC-like DNA-binding protein
MPAEPPEPEEYSEISAGKLHDRWVDAFWTLTATGGARRVLPDGCIDFIFDLDTGYGSVIGSMSASQIVQTPTGARRFGLRFAPGAAAPFIGVLASELTDSQADLNALTRARQFALAERIAEAVSGAQRIALLAEFLRDGRSRLRPRDARVRHATELLRASHGRLAISALAARLNLSERQLERLFHEHVGTRPKLFARVVRMQSALALLESRATPLAASAASAAGFADEAHLVRDFRALTGMTPRRLVEERRVGFVQPAPARSA